MVPTLHSADLDRRHRPPRNVDRRRSNWTGSDAVTRIPDRESATPPGNSWGRRCDRSGSCARLTRPMATWMRCPQAPDGVTESRLQYGLVGDFGRPACSHNVAECPAPSSSSCCWRPRPSRWRCSPRRARRSTPPRRPLSLSRVCSPAGSGTWVGPAPTTSPPDKPDHGRSPGTVARGPPDISAAPSGTARGMTTTPSEPVQDPDIDPRVTPSVDPSVPEPDEESGREDIYP